MRDHLPSEEADARLRHRFAIVDLWRPLARVEQVPLALCDARSIAQRDLVPSDLVYRDRTGETYSLMPNPEHRWYCFPDLKPDEPLLLKIDDSLPTVATDRAHRVRTRGRAVGPSSAHRRRIVGASSEH